MDGNGDACGRNPRKIFYMKTGSVRGKERDRPMEKKTVRLKNLIIGEGAPKICVPITGKNREEILAQGREAAAAGPDLLEWRADFWEGIREREKACRVLKELRGILKEIPILFTIRSREEGGVRNVTSEEYLALNLWAAGQQEISMVDIEVMHPLWSGKDVVKQIHQAGKPVIGSRHYFHRTPEREELKEIFQELGDSGADILKLAVMPASPREVLRLMEATLEEHGSRPQPLVTMSMGDLGMVSRISGSLTGSAVTFGSAAEASAPGQLPAEELRKILELLEKRK